jgi:ParB family chromosome partitioning protein
MAEKERRLGKGLDSLISAARERSLTTEVVGELGHRVQAVVVESIDPNPYQPRRDFPVESLSDLVGSLRTHGLLQPIVVRRDGEGYQLVAGERRWRAARELGWEHIDAVVVDADDQKMLEWSIIENLQREGLDAIELAHAFQRMIREFRLTQDEVARRVGQSRSGVANMIRLLELPAAVQERVSRGTVPMGAARALVTLGDPERQEEIANRIELEGLSVRQVESLARDNRKKPARGGRARDPNLVALAKEIEEVFGVKVDLQGSFQKGRLVFSYFSQGELDRLVRRLRGQAPQLAGPDGEDGEESQAITV